MALSSRHTMDHVAGMGLERKLRELTSNLNAGPKYEHSSCRLNRHCKEFTQLVVKLIMSWFIHLRKTLFLLLAVVGNRNLAEEVLACPRE